MIALHREWHGSFLCNCGVWIRTLVDQETQEYTYFHGDGEAVAIFAYADLAAWARSDLSQPHPMRAWCATVHDYELVKTAVTRREYAEIMTDLTMRHLVEKGLA